MILLQLFFTFFKIGLFNFGGGYAMIPLIQYEIFHHNWIESETLINFIAISESTPGTFAINISTYIGNITHGIIGAGVSTLSFALPSFIIIIFVAHFYEKFKRSRIVSGAMSGLRPAAIGLIGAAFISILRTVASSLTMDITTVIALVLFMLLVFLQINKIHPIFIILISACVGILTGILFNIPS